MASERGPGRADYKAEPVGKLGEMGDSPVGVEKSVVRVGRDT